MSNFPINDLRRRRLQTSLTVITLTLSVASTLFLLLFTTRLGFNATSNTSTLTMGISGIFSMFSLFVGVLIFVIGAVLTSFIAFLSMAQRTRDVGLIKAAGCPSSLVAGYFTTELLITSFGGCILGVVLGFVLDYGASSLVFSGYKVPNLWFVPLVFGVFFGLALFFGLRPIFKASKMSPAKALSPIDYYGLSVGNKRKPVSKWGLNWRVALRSLYRRQSATLRIVFLLSIVFILLTVSVSGGVIARDTTSSWVQNTVDPNTVAIATNSMGHQYEQLLAKFSGASINADFNYSDPTLAIPQTVIDQVTALPSVSLVDTRLVLNEHVQEIGNFSFGENSDQTIFVGSNRQGYSIVIGVDPSKLVGNWNVKGQFLSSNNTLDAVIGDSIAQTMYTPDPHHGINEADPLVEGISIENNTFDIVGVCVDPLNNGQVTYVPLEKLENLAGISNPNLLLIKLNSSIDRDTALEQIRSTVQASNSDLEVFTLNSVVEQNLSFLSSTWQTIMLIPLFTLVSAALSLVGYMMLAVDEQRQEFGVLRAIGARSRIIVVISAIQGAIVLASSFGVGISLGVITTLLILMANPVVTGFTVVEITVWLSAALLAMFLLSLAPAFRLAKTAILKIMA
jgi:ABC-type antimicrobial peptide transport system permease subunit